MAEFGSRVAGFRNGAGGLKQRCRVSFREGLIVSTFIDSLPSLAIREVEVDAGG